MELKYELFTSYIELSNGLEITKKYIDV